MTPRNKERNKETAMLRQMRLEEAQSLFVNDIPLHISAEDLEKIDISVSKGTDWQDHWCY